MKISVFILIVLSGIYLIFRKVKYGLRVKHFPSTVTGIQKHGQSIFFLLSFVFLGCIAAFRGDFSQDYPTYYYQLKIYEGYSFQQIFQVRDFGFAFFCKLITLITDNYIYFFVIMALITVMMYCLVIQKESRDYYLSLLMFVAVDNYIISFNLMRNILAVAMFFYLARYIWEKQPVKYVIGVLLIASVHRAAIILIPVYWLLGIDFRKRSNYICGLAGVAFFTIGLFYTKSLAVFLQSLIGMDYLSYGSYGLDSGNVGSALKTVVLFIIVLLLRKQIDFNDLKQRVWFNACLFNLALQLLAAKLLMIQRIGYFFSPFYLLLIPLALSKISAPRRKKIALGIILFIFIYCLFFQNVSNYYPVWENKKIRF